MDIQDLFNVLSAIPNRNVQLTSDQESIVKHTGGPGWVLAGPGSGKTEVLTITLLRLLYVSNDPIQQNLFPPESIVITTFTEKAARNLEDRLAFYRSFIIQTYPQLAAIDISKLRIGTLHGLCNDLLQEFRCPGYQNVRLMDSFEQAIFIHQHMSIVRQDDPTQDHDFWTHFQYLFTPREWQPGRNYLPSKWVKTSALEKLFGRIVEDRVDVSAMRQAGTQWARLADLYEEYLQHLEGSFRSDFSHLQKKFLDFLDTPLGQNFVNGGDPAGYEGIKYVLVDEYQDTNLIQEAIYMKLAGRDHNLVVVGDDDQAMYRFRGGSVECMVTFNDACNIFLGVAQATVQPYSLNTNFRSHPDIVQFCNDYITSFQQMQQPGARVPNKPDLTPGSNISGDYDAVCVLSATRAGDLPARFADCILGLVQNNIVNDPSECCLLLKSTRESARNAGPYVQALNAVGLQAYNPRSKAFFDQEEILGLLGAMLAILDPALAKLPERPQDLPDLINEAASVFAQFRAANPSLDQYVSGSCARIAAANLGAYLDANLQELFYYVVSLPPFDAWQNDPARRFRMSKFTSLLEAYASMPVAGRPNVSRGSLQMSRHDAGQLNGGWLSQFYYLFCAYVARQGMDDIEDDEVICPPGRVPIMTMHQSKGLEFPFVFVGHPNADAKPGPAHDIEDALAPFPLNAARVFSRPSAQERAELDLIRQYFVAYSRAQHALIVVGATNQTNKGRIPCGPDRTWLRNNSVNI